MRSTRAIELSTGLFALLGFAALFFLTTQISNKQIRFGESSYHLLAKFENVGSLKVGAPVSMAGVTHRAGRDHRLRHRRIQGGGHAAHRLAL